jgi:hypothetical protein
MTTDQQEEFAKLYDKVIGRIQATIDSKPHIQELQTAHIHYRVAFNIKHSIIHNYPLATARLHDIMDFYNENYMILVKHQDHRVVARTILDLLPRTTFHKAQRDLLETIWRSPVLEEIDHIKIIELKRLRNIFCHSPDWRFKAEVVERIISLRTGDLENTPFIFGWPGECSGTGIGMCIGTCIGE